MIRQFLTFAMLLASAAGVGCNTTGSHLTYNRVVSYAYKTNLKCEQTKPKHKSNSGCHSPVVGFEGFSVYPWP